MNLKKLGRHPNFYKIKLSKYLSKDKVKAKKEDSSRLKKSSRTLLSSKKEVK